MDLAFFRMLNDLAGLSRATDLVAVFLASYLQYVLAVAALVLFWRNRAELSARKMALQMAAAVVLSRFVITPVIRLFIERPRPFIALDSAVQLVDVRMEEYFNSFPSGHAAFFFALAGAIYVYDKKRGYWFFAGAVLMGVARVFAGVHWPSDIIGGAVIGIASVWLVRKLWK